jgi:hypothetical protein
LLQIGQLGQERLLPGQLEIGVAAKRSRLALVRPAGLGALQPA